MIGKSERATILTPRRRRRRGLAAAFTKIRFAVIKAVFFAFVSAAWAGEGPFFITYTHQMEEPGNLEFGTKNVTGRPSGGDRFMGTTEEFEYGVKAGWHASCAPDGSPLVGAGRRRPGKNLRAALSAIIPKRPGAWPIQFYDGCSMLARFPQRGRASSRLPGLARADLPFLAVHSRLPGR